MRPFGTIAVNTLTDSALFAGLVGGPTWRAWHAFVHAVYGVVPTDPELQAIILKQTGRSRCPTRPAREVFNITGRRGGKSLLAAVLAIISAVCRTYRLAPGERGVVAIIAADRKQARVIKRYISAAFRDIPMLAEMLAEDKKESIDLTNGITIEIYTASFRSIRGYTIVAAICDEVAFWPSEDSANPDVEILNALRPAMATIPDALLLVISSPYARRGELWRAYKEHFGQDDDSVLVWQADTRTMNPTVDQAVIDRAYAEDAAAADAEYGAEFRRDLETYVAREVLDQAVAPDRRELSRQAGVRYTAFGDPSGGSSDSMALAIVHVESDMIVLDAVREKLAPFNPEQAVEEFAGVLKAYGISKVTGDRYAGEWPVARFRAHGITYQTADKSKSDLYAAFLPKLNSGQVELLDHPRLIHQLSSLERRTARGGRDSIDHPPRQRDDLANAVAGAVVYAGRLRVSCIVELIKPRDAGPRASQTMQAIRAAKSERLHREVTEMEAAHRPVVET